MPEIYQKTRPRPIPDTAERINSKQVRIKLRNGKTAIREVRQGKNGEPDMMLDISQSWYVDIWDKGERKTHCLGKDKLAAQVEMGKLLDSAKNKRHGWNDVGEDSIKIDTLLAEYKTHCTERGFAKATTEGIRYLVHTLRELEVKTLGDIRDAGFADLVKAKHKEWKTPRNDFKLPAKGEYFTLKQLEHITGRSVIDMAKWMHANGIESQGIGKYPPEAPPISKFYNRGERQVFVATRKAAQTYLDTLNNPFCARTLNNRIARLKAFLEYLRKECKINSVIKLPDPIPARVRQLLPNRAMKEEELQTLVDSVLKLNKESYGMTPQQRVAYYQTAFYTMIRRRGLTELLIKNCHLDGDQPYIHVLPETDKCRVERSCPLPPHVAASIKAITEGRDGNQCVWRVKESFNKMLRNDMRRAGIAITTDDGKFNCHSFRKSGACYYMVNRVDLLYICEMGGWRSPNVLLKVYKQLMHSDYRQHLPAIFHKTEP